MWRHYMKYFSFYDSVGFEFAELISQRLLADFSNILFYQAVSITISSDHMDDAWLPLPSNEIHAIHYRTISRCKIFCLAKSCICHWSEIMCYT